MATTKSKMQDYEALREAEAIFNMTGILCEHPNIRAKDAVEQFIVEWQESLAAALESQGVTLPLDDLIYAAYDGSGWKIVHNPSGGGYCEADHGTMVACGQALRPPHEDDPMLFGLEHVLAWCRFCDPTTNPQCVVFSRPALESKGTP